MSQNRKAPAYQEYAAAILAQLPFRTITLQDRGLLWTMRMECWVNKQLPNNPNVIAKALGLPVDEVVTSLPAVMPFFRIEGDFIICPELEDYRMHIEKIRKKKSTGGQNSAAKKAKERRNKPVESGANDVSTILKESDKNLKSNLVDSCNTLLIRPLKRFTRISLCRLSLL